MFGQDNSTFSKSYFLRGTVYTLIILSMLAAGCRSTSQAKIAVSSPTTRSSAPTPTPTPETAEAQCTVPKNLPLADDKPAIEIWKGKTGDHNIVWTTKNISAVDERTKQTTFLLDKYALRKTVEELGEPASWYCDAEYYGRSYKILSVAGNILSLEETAVSSPQTYVSVKYRAVDLSDEKRTPLLTDYFAAKDVFGELSKVPIIKAAIAARLDQMPEAKNKVSAPKSIDEFQKLFDCSAAEKQDGKESCGDVELSGENSDATRVSINRDLFNGFAFENTESGRITVKLLIPAVTGNRGEEGVPVTLQFSAASLLDSPAKIDPNKAVFLSKDKNKFWKKNGQGDYLSSEIILASNR